MAASGRAAISDPQGGSRNLQAVAPWIFALAATLLGLAAGWAALHFSGAFHLRLSLIHIALLAAALLAAVPVMRRPALGVVALIFLVYLNVSDILIRFHDLPSLLQLLAIPLLLAVLVEWRRGALKGLEPKAVTVALAAYVLVFVVSSVVAQEPVLADARAVEAAKGFGIFVLILLLATRPERVRAGAWALVGGGLLLAGLSLFQVVTGAYRNDFGGLARVEHAQVYGHVLESRLAGPIGDPNFFAQILVIVVPVALVLAWKERTRWLRLLAVVAAAATAATTIFTYSRGGALALGVVALCSLFAAHPSRRRVTIGAALLLVAGLALVPTQFARRLVTLRALLPGEEPTLELDSSVQYRVLLAQVAWRLFLDHPVLGAGAGNYAVHYYEYADEVGSTALDYREAGGARYPHSLYLELASETGFLGLITFGTMILLVFGHLRRAEEAYFTAGDELHAALASALAIALLGFLISSLFLHGHFQRYLWVLLGLSAALAAAAPAVTDAGSLAGGGPTMEERV
jgi:hypothetical protein